MELSAFGPVASALAQVKAGSQLKLVGFLDKKGGRPLMSGALAPLAVHVTEFALLD